MTSEDTTLSWIEKINPLLLSAIRNELAGDTEALALLERGDDEKARSELGTLLAIRANKPDFLFSSERFLEALAEQGPEALKAAAESSIRNKPLYDLYADFERQVYGLKKRD